MSDDPPVPPPFDVDLPGMKETDMAFEHHEQFTRTSGRILLHEDGTFDARCVRTYGTHGASEYETRSFGKWRISKDDEIFIDVTHYAFNDFGYFTEDQLTRATGPWLPVAQSLEGLQEEHGDFVGRSATQEKWLRSGTMAILPAYLRSGIPMWSAEVRYYSGGWRFVNVTEAPTGDG